MLSYPRLIVAHPFLLVTWHPICSPPPQGVVVGALIKVLFPSHCQDDPGRQDPLLSESLEFYLEFLELFGIFTSSLLKRIILFYKIVRFDVSATPYWIPSIHLFSGAQTGCTDIQIQTFSSDQYHGWYWFIAKYTSSRKGKKKLASTRQVIALQLIRVETEMSFGQERPCGVAILFKLVCPKNAQLRPPMTPTHSQRGGCNEPLPRVCQNGFVFFSTFWCVSARISKLLFFTCG